MAADRKLTPDSQQQLVRDHLLAEPVYTDLGPAAIEEARREEWARYDRAIKDGKKPPKRRR